MANQLVAQGTLNRLRGSVIFNSFPSLNITSPFLGVDGISLTFEGDITQNLPQMTGVVTSPEPYQMFTLTAQLMRTQSLANAFKIQLETLSTIGDFTVRTDSSVLGVYDISNGSIVSVAPIKANGTDASFMITLRGIYYINSTLFN